MKSTDCQQQQHVITEKEKEAVAKEVKDRFNELVSAVNQLNTGAWSEYYSKDSFLSAIAGGNYYADRSAWVDTITNYFSMREQQHVEPVAVRVTALSPGIALMTSEEKTEMQLKDGNHIQVQHAFSMIWAKEPDGWKILHSHESWIE